MEFCTNCDNMLYIRHENDKVFHKCNACLKEFDTFGTKSRCISVTKSQKESASYESHMNEHVVDDPTLPVLSTVVCPNATCTRAPDAANQVIYIKYDNTGMRFLYCCKHCRHFWTLA